MTKSRVFMIKMITVVLMGTYSFIGFSQSIVNTEKLFKENKNGFSFSSEINGNLIYGNANISILRFSLNSGYFKDKWSLKFLSGGQNIVQENDNLNTSLFSQLRFNYFIRQDFRFISFFQLQSNNILLLNRRALGGLGLRKNLIEVSDSSVKINFDGTFGIIQEQEILNGTDLTSQENENLETNYLRSSFVLNVLLEIKDKITLINTTYLQQRFVDLKDYRILNEVNLNIPISKSLTITFDFEFRFDSKPPSILGNKDFNTTAGIRYTY